MARPRGRTCQRLEPGKPPCAKPAVQGAYCWPDPTSKPGHLRWFTNLFCEEHGRLAVEKGARWVSWRPKCTAEVK